MNRTVATVLGLLGFAAVLALMIWLVRRPRPAPHPEEAPPAAAPVVPAVVARTVTRYVVDSSRWVPVRDSLNRELARLRRDSSSLGDSLKRADDALRALEAPSGLPVSAGEAIALLGGGYRACRAALGNCEERARTEGDRADAAEAQMARVNRRAVLVAGGAAAVGGAAVLGADREVVIATAVAAALAVWRLGR